MHRRTRTAIVAALAAALCASCGAGPSDRPGYALELTDYVAVFLEQGHQFPVGRGLLDLHVEGIGVRPQLFLEEAHRVAADRGNAGGAVEHLLGALRRLCRGRGCSGSRRMELIVWPRHWGC